MIELFSGTPGSGKSLHTASIIKYRCFRKKITICNFDVKCKKNNSFIYLDNDFLNPQWLLTYSKIHFKNKKFREDDIYLIIDEAQLIFNCREYGAINRKEWIKFFTQHRHLGYRVILIAQMDTMLDKQIRGLIEYNTIHRKVSNFGLRGKLLSLVSGGHLFCSIKIWYPMKQRVSSDFFHARKSLYSIYDTTNLFGYDKK